MMKMSKVGTVMITVGLGGVLAGALASVPSDLNKFHDETKETKKERKKFLNDYIKPSDNFEDNVIALQQADHSGYLVNTYAHHENKVIAAERRLGRYQLTMTGIGMFMGLGGGLAMTREPYTYVVK